MAELLIIKSIITQINLNVNISYLMRFTILMNIELVILNYINSNITTKLLNYLINLNFVLKKR
jgi:hypothetical protein